MAKYTFFWGGPFSQWYLCNFSIRGIVYNCAEQFMMTQKALLFEDYDIVAKIRASKSPKEQKALGRKVRGFSVEKWDEYCMDIVYRGNWEKFTQNPELEKILLDTEGTILVEASPYDKIWGIGLDENNPLAYNKETWKGENRLGNILTQVRDNILKNR